MSALRFGHAAKPAFALETDCVFLNHGSFGAPPRRVLEQAASWRTRIEAQPVRFFESDMPRLLRQAAARLAQFLGARGEDLGFVTNATEGANAVLRSIALAPGDEVVTTDHAYGAVRKAIDHIAGRAGARVVVAPVPFPTSGEQVVVDAVASALTSRARLLVIDHITSPTALVWPARRLVELARGHAIAVLVDGAHAPGQVPLDLEALDADYYIGNCHKWLFAPKGCAFLWARADRQGTLHPVTISHGYGQGLTAELYWQGTRDVAAWLAVVAAIDFIETAGARAIMEHNRALAAEAASLLADAWRAPLGGPESMRGAMASLGLPVEHPATIETARAIRRRLWDHHRIEVPIFPFGGRLWLRISAQIYNAIEDYQRLARALAA